jgi:hypothetical protein
VNKRLSKLVLGSGPLLKRQKLLSQSHHVLPTMLLCSQGSKYDTVRSSLNPRYTYTSDLYKRSLYFFSYLHLGLHSRIFPSGFLRFFYAFRTSERMVQNWPHFIVLDLITLTMFCDHKFLSRGWHCCFILGSSEVQTPIPAILIVGFFSFFVSPWK